MDKLRENLRLLCKESVEQIEACVLAASTLHEASVSEKVVAACIVHTKLSDENETKRIEELVPSICLIDALLKHSSNATQVIGHECSKLLPFVIATMSIDLKGSPGAGEKIRRFAKRWFKDNKISHELHDAILLALKGEGPRDNEIQQESATQENIDVYLTGTQATELSAMVCTISKLIPQLPQHRREVYLKVLKPRLSTTLKWSNYESSAPFLRHLCSELRQEVAKYTSGSGNVKTEGGSAVLTDKKPQALLQLLETIEKQAQLTHDEEASAASLITSDRDQSITCRYVSPFLCDVLGHHSPGSVFGFCAPQRAGAVNPPRRHPAGNRNPKLPFAYPASINKEKGGACRQWFLREEAWTSTPDFGALQFVVPRAAKFVQLADGTGMKRQREEAGDVAA